MNHKQESKNKAWILASVAAPIAHVASGLNWGSVLLASLCAAGIRWALAFIKRSKIRKLINSILCAAVLGLTFNWMRQCWGNQKNIEWILGILLLLAGILVYKGIDCAVNAAAVLWWIVAFLLGSVLVSSVQEIEISNLLADPRDNIQTGLLRLIVLLVLPVLINDQETTPGRMVPLSEMALLFSICTGGVLTPEYAGRSPAPFYELSRSIRLYGMLERTEALAWIGMMLGTYLYITFLLTGMFQKEKQG